MPAPATAMTATLTERLMAYRDSLGNPESRALIADVLDEMSRAPWRESRLLEAAKAVAKAQADFKTWAEAGVMRGLLPYSEADLRKASLAAFDGLKAAIAQAEPRA